MSTADAFLLAIDVGNTNISLGLFDLLQDPERVPTPPRGVPSGEAGRHSRDGARKLRADWRIETRTGRTADEYVAILSELFRRADLAFAATTSAAIPSVLPPIVPPLGRTC